MHITNITCHDQKAIARWLNRVVYRLPDPLDTQSQYNMYIHDDLTCMTPAELRQELGRIQLRLLLEERPNRWLCERDTAVRNALRARRTQG